MQETWAEYRGGEYLQMLNAFIDSYIDQLPDFERIKTGRVNEMAK